MSGSKAATAVTTVFFAICCSPLAFGTVPGAISLTLTSKAQVAGPALYEIRAVVFGGTLLAHLTMPGGDEFPMAPPGAISNLSQSEALAKLIGSWTLTTRRPGIPDQWEDYTFNVGLFTESNFFSVPPTIVSPVAGSTVPPQFLLTFEWPAGTTPPVGRSASSIRGLTIESLDLNVTSGSNSFPINVTFKPGQTEGSLTLSAGSGEALDRFVSAVTPSVTDPYWSFTARLAYSNLSTPVSFTVSAVPEPGPMAIGGVVAFLATMRRAHRRPIG